MVDQPAERPEDGPDPVPSPTVIDARMLDEIFGDVLPDTTSDERGPGGECSYSEQWYRENTPPHHG